MDKDFIDFLKLIPQLVAAIVTLNKLHGDGEKKRADALDALRKAAHETEGYYASGAIDRQKEHELGHLWQICAERIKNYDEGLANRFELKRNYWVSPEKWTKEQIEAAQIGLEDIKTDAERLLKFNVKPVKKAKR